MEFFKRDILQYILLYVLNISMINDYFLNQIIDYQLVCRDWYAIINSIQFNKLVLLKPEHINQDIWNKIKSKYPKFLIENKNKCLFSYNFMLYVYKFMPEYQLYQWNYDLQNSLTNKKEHKKMVKNLKFPTDFSPNIFSSYLAEIKTIFEVRQNPGFYSWLDHLIELYHVPYQCEATFYEPRFIDWNLFRCHKNKAIYNYKNHNVYWDTITNILINELRSYNFIVKYFADLNWNSKLFQLIDQEFILSHSVLWEYWNIQDFWNKIIINVQFTEDFIENIIIKDLFNKRKFKINFSYIFKNQNLSEEFFNKIFVSSKDNHINNDTNWYIILESNYVSDYFRRTYNSKKQKTVLNV